MNIISERTDFEAGPGSHFKIFFCKVVVQVVDTKFCPSGFSAQRCLEEKLERHLLKLRSQIEFGTFL